MRNIKYKNSLNRKKNSSINTINKTINSLTSLYIRDIYKTFRDQKKIKSNKNQTSLTFLDFNNISLNNSIECKNKKILEINKNKLKIDILKSNKITKIKPIKSFNGINSINTQLKNNTYYFNTNKKMNLNNLVDLKRSNLKSSDIENNLTKNKNNDFSQTTYNIYNVNTPIYNLINFPSIINNKKYFSPRNDFSYFSNKNKDKIMNKRKNNVQKNILNFSDSENEKNQTVTDYRPFSLRNKIFNIKDSNNKFINKNKIKNQKYLHTNSFNEKINFFKFPVYLKKIAKIKQSKKLNNIIKSKNIKYKINHDNNNRNIKPKLTEFNKYLNLVSPFGSNSKKFQSQISKKSISSLSQLNNSNISNKIKNTTTTEKPKIIITKKVMKINSCTLAGYTNTGRQKLNQDKFFIKKEFLEQPEQFFIGVCDGHGMFGHFVSEYVIKFLPEKVNSISTDESIKEAFLTIQKSLLNENTKIDISLSGTTCTSVIISPEKIICANIGDSRAILARYENGTYNVINLSRDHKLTEPDEMKRIINNGGVIKQYYNDKNKEYIGPKRVFLNNIEIPGLPMSRSIGDSIAHNIGVISEPEIFKFNYKGNEKFIIVASDGIWKYIDSEECVNIMKEYYENNMDAIGGLNTLVKEAFKRWKNEEEIVDDITVIVVFFE